MPGIVIAPFNIEHYDAVYALWESCPGVGLSRADERQSISAYLARNPGMSFIASDRKQVIGAILGGHDGRRGYIHHLAVHADYRRQGVGQSLVDRCLETLQQAAIQKCHLFIFHENLDGIAFWRANDWTLRQDILVMSRHLVADRPAWEPLVGMTDSPIAGAKED